MTEQNTSREPAFFDELRAVVVDMQAKGRSTRIAGVKPSLKRRYPAFDENRLGYPTFRAFLEAAVDHGAVRLVADGAEWVRVEVPDGKGSSDIAAVPTVERMRPDIWRAFTDWREGWVRCWDRARSRAVRISAMPRPHEPADHAALRADLANGSAGLIRIEPVPMEEQRSWMVEFADGLGEHTLANPLKAALDDPRPFRAFALVLSADPELRARYAQAKFEHVLDAVRHWASRNEIDLDALDHRVGPSGSPARSADGVVLGGKGGAQTTAALRVLLHSAIDEMSGEELRRLSVPIGYLIDGLR